MEKKKSFVLYADMLESIDHLSFEEKGILFDHILKFANGQDNDLKDRLIITAWKPIESQLKRDLEKWDKTLEQRSKAGKASAESRKLSQHNLTKSTHVKCVQRTSTNSTDNVNVNENVNVNDFNKKKLSIEDKTYQHNQYFQNIWKQKMWVESICIQNQKNTDDLKFHLNKFRLECIAKEDFKESEKDAKNHFVNWMKKGNPIETQYLKGNDPTNWW